MSQTNVKCEDVYRYLIEELDETLDQESRAVIRTHLQQCSDCTFVLKSLRKTISLYKAMPDAIVPASLTSHILETIKKSGKHS